MCVSVWGVGDVAELGACLPIVQGARFGPHLSCLGNKSSSTFTVCVGAALVAHKCECVCVRVCNIRCFIATAATTTTTAAARSTGAQAAHSTPPSPPHPELTCLLLVKTYNLRVISCHTKRTCNPPSHLLFAYSTFASPSFPFHLPPTTMPCVLKVLTQKLDS